jgi:antitoxin YobK
MSMEDYEKAKALMKGISGTSTFAGPKTPTLISLAEKQLNIKFPEVYRRFLIEFGAGGLGFFEIYGIINEDFENSRIPDVVWFTLRMRNEANLPSFLLPVYELGDGELYCLDLRIQQGDEAKVVGFTPGYTSPNQSLDIVAEDFGELLLDLVQLDLKFKRT